MFMNSSRASERELRLETATDCIELAAERNRLGDSSEIVALQLDRLIHQIVALAKEESESKIAELLINGTNIPEEEIIELLSNHVGRESEGTDLDDCLIEVL